MEKYVEYYDMYTSNYDMRNPMIKALYHHSYRVMELSRKIATSLRYDKEDILLAQIIGLLHSLGKFEEIKQEVDNDKKIDSTEYALQYLFEEKQIKYFIDDKNSYSIIRKAIQFYDKSTLPSRGLTSKERKHLKLIRDTNKLDVLYELGILGECKLDLTGKNIRPEISSYFFERKVVPEAMIKSDDELVIYYLSTIYDLNYKESYRHLRLIRLLEIFFENLDRPNNLNPFFEFLIDYIDRKCN